MCFIFNSFKTNSSTVVFIFKNLPGSSEIFILLNKFQAPLDHALLTTLREVYWDLVGGAASVWINWSRIVIFAGLKFLARELSLPLQMNVLLRIFKEC